MHLIQSCCQMNLFNTLKDFEWCLTVKCFVSYEYSYWLYYYYYWSPLFQYVRVYYMLLLGFS